MQIVPYNPKKHHPIPADVLPNDSEALLEISALNDLFFNPSKIVVYDGTGEIRNDVDSPVAQYYSVPFSFLDIFFSKPTQSLYRIDQSLY